MPIIPARSFASVAAISYITSGAAGQKKLETNIFGPSIPILSKLLLTARQPCPGRNGGGRLGNKAFPDGLLCIVVVYDAWKAAASGEWRANCRLAGRARVRVRRPPPMRSLDRHPDGGRRTVWATLEASQPTDRILFVCLPLVSPVVAWRDRASGKRREEGRGRDGG